MNRPNPPSEGALPTLAQFVARKQDHMRLALDPAHQALGQSDLTFIELLHDALPELDADEVDITTVAPFGSAPRLATPFFIAGMTAGHADAPELNRRLAAACARRGWLMAIGSQRRDWDDQSALMTTQEYSALGSLAGLSLIGNLGVTQLVLTSRRIGIAATLERIESLAKAAHLSAIAIHLNSLQERIQPEGTPAFRGAVELLAAITTQLKLPVILKETGCGFSPRALAKLKGLKLWAIDVSGRGGTHWGRIEGSRAAAMSANSVAADTADTFADWGVSTVQSTLSAVAAGVSKEVWSTGGVRSGLDAAKLLAIGATRVGYAQPALKAAQESEQSLDQWMARQEFELKTALFCTGSRTVNELQSQEGRWKRNEK